MTDDRETRYQYWAALKRAKEFYSNLTVGEFIDTMNSKYGLEVFAEQNGYITGNKQILDEKKYLMFLMKFHP